LVLVTVELANRFQTEESALLADLFYVEREESVAVEDLVSVPFQGVDGRVLGSLELAFDVQIRAVGGAGEEVFEELRPMFGAVLVEDVPPFTLTYLEVPHFFIATIVPDCRQSEDVPGLIVIVVRDRDGFQNTPASTASETIDGSVYRRERTGLAVSAI
jgi:hypothetical protein